MLVQSLLNGLTMGGIYALVSVGLTIIFGVMKVVNFSQGECLMVGMYMAYVLQQFTGLGPYYLMLPVAALTFGLGILIFRLIIKPILGKSLVNFMIVTMGLAYVLITGVQLIFSPTPLSIQTTIRTHATFIGPYVISTPRVIAIGVMIVVVLILYTFLKRTDVGRAMRATSENAEISQMLGINTTRMYMLSFGLGIMMAGLTGVLLTPTYLIFPAVGNPFKVIAMAVVVMGGLGSVGGAVLAGLFAGVAEAMIASYYSFELAPGGIFLALIIVLALRPEGLFGKEARKA